MSDRRADTGTATARLVDALIAFITTELYPGREVIGLHEPSFDGNERAYVLDAIDSTFVSSVGKYVDRFEEMVAAYTGATRGVATVNGTAALHVALRLVGVKPGDLVITQPVTFVATANAIRYCAADPVFVDVDEDTLGLSPTALAEWLTAECDATPAGPRHRATGRRVAACVPMHTFGFPVRITEISDICERAGIPLVEDAAESLGSFVGGTHTGRFGRLGVLSFNGNKTITTGGGGMIITDDVELGKHAKHLTTTAKTPHRWEYVHDEVGYNYRLPNLNAALGCAQMERLPGILAAKRIIAEGYARVVGSSTSGDSGGMTPGVAAIGVESNAPEAFAARTAAPPDVTLLPERPGTTANHWLTALRMPDRTARDALLTATNDTGIMTRPLWELMYRLPAFSGPSQHAVTSACPNAEDAADTFVNLPSWPVPAEKSDG